MYKKKGFKDSSEILNRTYPKQLGELLILFAIYCFLFTIFYLHSIICIDIFHK